MDVDDEWAQFMLEGKCEAIKTPVPEITTHTATSKCSSLFISTRSVIGYLNHPIPTETFWKIPVMLYRTPKNGVVKKQMMLNTTESIYDVLFEDDGHIETEVRRETLKTNPPSKKKSILSVGQKAIIRVNSSGLQATQSAQALAHSSGCARTKAHPSSATAQSAFASENSGAGAQSENVTILTVKTAQDMYADYMKHIEIAEREATEQNLLFKNYVHNHVETTGDKRIFKDERVICVGISHNDLLNQKNKPPDAFINSFTLTLRVLTTEYNIKKFREYHVKVFKTGKIEIAGVRNNDILLDIYKELLETLRPFLCGVLISPPSGDLEMAVAKGECLTNPQNGVFDFVGGTRHAAANPETVLINAGFDCGFDVKLDALESILRNKYKLMIRSDACTYQGIQCSYFYDTTHAVNTYGIAPKKMTLNYVKITISIFRTGSVIIIGKCDEKYALATIYEFLCNLFKNEFVHIAKKTHESIAFKSKKEKKRQFVVNGCA